MILSLALVSVLRQITWWPLRGIIRLGAGKLEGIVVSQRQPFRTTNRYLYMFCMHIFVENCFFLGLTIDVSLHVRFYARLGRMMGPLCLREGAIRL